MFPFPWPQFLTQCIVEDGLSAVSDVIILFAMLVRVVVILQLQTKQLELERYVLHSYHIVNYNSRLKLFWKNSR
jgi:hypothetical protein